MAIEKILNTRILNKIDTLENWNSSTLPIKKGEICLATVAATAGTGLTEPVIMIKVGEDGVKTFKDLEWNVYAKASDVLAACKSEAALKTFINGVIADAGIASSDAMEALAGRVTTAEGEIDTLQSEMDAVEKKAADNEAAIGALEELVGTDKNVHDQIQDAIAALNLSTTYEKKGEAEKVQTALNTYKTSNDAAVQKNATDIAGEITRAKAAEEANANAISAIKDGTTIDSFADVESALAGKETAGAATDALDAAKSYADGLAGNYDAKGSAAQALTDAKAYANGLAGNYDAHGSAAQALVDAKAYTDAEITEWVGDKTVGVQISEAIAAEKLGETYAAKIHKHTKSDITDFAHNHEISEVNGLQDALNGKETVGAAAAALTEAKSYADGLNTAMDERVAELEGMFGEGEGTVETQIEAAVATETAAREAADTALGNRIKAIEDDHLVGADKTELQGKITENATAIAGLVEDLGALEELVGDESVKDQIDTAIAEEAKIARAAEKANADAIEAINKDYLKAADKTELQGQITANANAIELLTNGVNADEVDGVNDLIQYVKTHGTEVTGIKADIKANSDAIDAIEADYLKAADKTELNGLITGLTTRMGEAETAIGTKAAQSDLNTLAGRVTTVEGDLNTATTGLKARMTAAEDAIEDLGEELQTLTGGESVQTQIETAVNELKNGQLKTMQGEIDAVEGRVDTLEGKAHEHANKAELDKFVDGDKAKLDSAVQTVTAGTGLKATKTGTDVAIAFDEDVVFVFDCGDSKNV